MKRLSTYLRTGESLPILLGYWLPELIILCITTALPPLVDSYFVSHLHSATSYGALGMATNFLHTLVKLSEAIPVAAIAIIGRHNGARNLEAAGRHFMHTLGAAFLLGTGQLILVNAGAHHIYQWLGVPSDMALIGAPFLKLRSVSVLLAFILLALLGFMRAIKNTTTPMFIMIGGSALYILASAILIRGWGPFPAYGLYGPAIAALLQYGSMIVFACVCLLRCAAYRPYLARLSWRHLNLPAALAVIATSLPVAIDKITLALSYVWLSKMLAAQGTTSIATFDIIKNLERSAIMPAAAFAQVLTMLVSNHLGAESFQRARGTIVKVLLVTGGLVLTTLSALSLWPSFFVGLLAPHAAIATFAAPLLKILSFFAFFDFMQLILAGALRGAGHVKTVMWTRFLITGLFFLPISYILSQSSFENPSAQFCSIYGAFYVSTALMGLVFLKALSHSAWHTSTIKQTH